MTTGRRKIFRLLLSVTLGLVLLAGCLPAAVQQRPVTTYRDARLVQDTFWSGRILIDGSVHVAKGATLTILPGTEVAFVRQDQDQDGLGDGTLVVEGRLIAVGTRQEPILIHSAADTPQPGDWLELRVDFSKEVRLRFCEIRDSAYTLHAHFTRGVVEDCWIHHNIDGCRLGQASFTFRHNLYEHNQGKGINFRNSRVDIHHNIIRYNGSGIFLFESDQEISIHANNLYGNLDNFRLGDFYTGDVSLRGNWWGTAAADEAQATVYDQQQDPAIGRVSLQPARAWVADAGPRDALALEPAWDFASAGYIDADPVAAGERLYVASWDGHLYVLDGAGRVSWSKNLGDTLDATPAVAEDLVVLQTWSREVHALDPVSRQVRWRFDYSPSRADDHRQGGVLLLGDLVLVPAWNGTLFALDRATGETRWEFAAGQPLRARPASDGERIYLADGAGALSALSLQGELLWQARLSAPLLSEPVLSPAGVAVLGRDGELAAFDRDGRELWRRELAETCYYGAPVSQAEALFVPTAAGALWKIEAASGRLLWRQETAGPVYATPLVARGRVYVGDNSGVLQVFGADSGSLLASHRIEREIQSRPLLWQGLLLFGSRDHHLHALTLDERPVP